MQLDPDHARADPSIRPGRLLRNYPSAMVDLLLASGARTPVRDKSGLTAADYARQYGHAGLIPKLAQ